MFGLFNRHKIDKIEKHNKLILEEQMGKVYNSRFQEKLLYLYQNSNKLLLLMYYYEETGLSIADFSSLLFQNKELGQMICYRKMEKLLESYSFDPVGSDNKMECSIALLDMLYHIIDSQYQSLEDDEQLEEIYEERLEYIMIALSLFQNIKQYSYLKEWFDIRESFFDEDSFQDYYRELKKQEQELPKPTLNELVKHIYRNNMISMDRKLIDSFSKKIENIELNNYPKGKTYII